MKFRLGIFRKIILKIVLLLAALVLSCSMREGDVQPRLNPLDPLNPANLNGSHFFTQYLAVSSKWSNFSFIDSTGSLQCSLLTAFEFFNLYYGKHEDSLILLSLKEVTTFELSGIERNQQYIFKFTGYSRGSDSKSEIFSETTPYGMPPFAPDGIIGEGTTYGASFEWNAVKDAKNYVVHRFDSSGNRAVLPILFTNSCDDTLEKYDEYSYVIGSVNQYGIALSNNPVSIRKIAAIQPPNNCTASNGLFADRIALSWNRITGASGYRIYRSVAQKDNYTSVMVVNDTQYNDPCVIKGPFYYKIASIDDSGYTGVAGKYFYGSITDSLEVPSEVVASNGELSDAIAVLWKPVSGAQYYNIYRSLDSNGVYLFLNSIAGSYNYFTDTTVGAIVNYYKVSVVDSNKIETRKSYFAVGSVMEIEPPIGISASEGTHLSVITVSWDTVSGAQMYYLYRSLETEGPFSLICSTGVNFYQDSIGIDSCRYYKLSYRKKQIESTVSAAVKGWTITHQAPQNLTATLGTYYSHVALQWEEMIGAVGYVVYRSESSTGIYNIIASITSAKYSDSTVTTNDYFYYRVAVLYPNMASGPLSASTQGFAAMVDRPVGLVSKNIFPDKVFFSWNTVTGASYYIVYRSPASLGVYTEVDTVTDTSYSGLLPIPSTNAYFKVAAGVRSRNSFQSSAVYATLFSPPSSVTYFRQLKGIYLTWSSVVNARAFKVYRAINDTLSFTCIDSVTVYATSDTAMTSTGTYYYKVSTIGDSGESRMSSSIKVNFVTGPPTLTATALTGSVRLIWPKVNGISSYVIYRSEYPDSGFSEYSSSTDTTFIDNNLPRSGDYYYRIQGYIATGSFYSTPSPIAKATVIVKPRAPLLLSGLSYEGYIQLVWSPDTSGAQQVSYIVYRSSTSSGTYTPLDTVTTTSYVYNLDNTTYWYYRISALNQAGESALSSYRYVAAKAHAAPVPITTSYYLYGSHISFSWNSVQNANAYIVYRAQPSSGTKTALDTISDTVYNDSSAQASQAYYYTVQAKMISGALSTISNQLSGYRLGPPSTISSTGYPNYIQLSWSRIFANNVRYYIYRSALSTGVFIKIDSTNNISYNDSVITDDYYYYKISSVNLNESALSTSVGAKLSLPSIPVIVSASQGIDTAITVVWRKSSGIQSYKLYRSTSLEFLTPLLVAEKADTVFVDTVPSDSTYYYKVKVIGIGGESSLSSSVFGYRKPQVPPSLPQSLTASTNSTSYIYLSWIKPLGVAAVNGYKIYRSETNNGSYQVIDSTTSTAYYDYVFKTFPDSYWYVVKAWNSRGEGVESDTVFGIRQ